MSSRADPDARKRAAATRKRLNGSTRVARALLVGAGALGAVEVGLIVTQAVLLASIIAPAFQGGATLSGLWPRLAALVGVGIARGLVAAGFEYSGRLGAARVMAELRERLVAHLLWRRPGGLAKERRGELAASAVQGIDALEAYFARYLPQMVLAALTPPVVLAIVFPTDLGAAILLAVTFPLIPVFMVLIGRAAEHQTRRRWSTLSKLSAHFLDVVSGLETLRAHGRAEAQVETIGVAGDRYRSETMKTLRVGFLSALVLELLAMLGTALVAATVGVQLANGALGFQAGLTVLLLAPELYMPLRGVAAQFHASADGMAAAERIFEVLDQPATVSVPSHPRPCPDPGTAGVVFREVGFGHEGRPDSVLRDISFEIAAGETLALVGASGTGKSTLAALLLRLADPAEGGILCGGLDLREADPREWRRHIAWVPQRSTIFSATVAENVKLARPGATSEQVAAALAKAGAGEFVSGLPQGAETRIGESGRGLSAGQAQRIGVARAFLRDAPLVILDEPTAHLDLESERVVAASAVELVRGRTALVIAHRPAAIREADRILELSGGKLAAPRSEGLMRHE